MAAIGPEKGVQRKESRERLSKSSPSFLKVLKNVFLWIFLVLFLYLTIYKEFIHFCYTTDIIQAKKKKKTELIG